MNAKEITVELTTEANTIIDSVTDIVSLPKLREHSVVRACNEAIQYKQNTIDQLNELDQGKGTGRPIYEINFNGQTQRVAITTGSNGFIVGANPVSIK